MDNELIDELAEIRNVSKATILDKFIPKTNHTDVIKKIHESKSDCGRAHYQRRGSGYSSYRSRH